MTAPGQETCRFCGGVKGECLELRGGALPKLICRNRPSYDELWDRYLAVCDKMIVEVKPKLQEYKEAVDKTDELEVAQFACASEFPADGQGGYDTGSIHENIRLLKEELVRAKKEKEVLANRVLNTEAEMLVARNLLENIIYSASNGMARLKIGGSRPSSTRNRRDEEAA